MKRLIMRLPERFWAKAIIADAGYETPCLLWSAAKDSKGYGRFNLDGRNRRAHRLAYQAVVGPIPNDLQLDHLCRNRACVNPDHLEPVTSRENTRRGEGLAAVNARVTHCPADHPYDETNTGYRKDRAGSRYCRECQRTYLRGLKRRQRAAARAKSSPIPSPGGAG